MYAVRVVRVVLGRGLIGVILSRENSHRALAHQRPQRLMCCRLADLAVFGELGRGQESHIPRNPDDFLLRHRKIALADSYLSPTLAVDKFPGELMLPGFPVTPVYMSNPLLAFAPSQDDIGVGCTSFKSQ